MRSTFFDYSFTALGALDIGCVRASNQDRLILADHPGFFAVSDGMGGLTNGGDTADLVARIVPEHVARDSVDLDPTKPDPARAGVLLKDIVQSLSDGIAEAANSNGFVGFGATFSGLWLIGAHAVFVNVGDSRAYKLDCYGRVLRQISADHNIAEMLVRNGEITREQARNHPASYRLTRFIGMKPPCAADVFIEPVRPGDRIVLCSDGLYGEVEDHDIKMLLRSSKSPRTVCCKLIEAAKSAGGHDNISVVYIRIGR